MISVNLQLMAVIATVLIEIGFYGMGMMLYEKRFGRKMQVTPWEGCAAVVSPLAILYALISYGESAPNALEQTFFFIMVILIGIIDSREQIVPNKLVVSMLIMKMFWVILYFVTDREYAAYSMAYALVGLAGTLIICALARLVFRKAIGLGDVKLLISLAVCVGISKCMYILLAACMMAVIKIAIERMRHRMAAGDAVSFGPFVAWGMMLVLGFGIQ